MRNKHVLWIAVASFGIVMLLALIWAMADYSENANVVSSPKRIDEATKLRERVPSAILDYGGDLEGCRILSEDRFACITRLGKLFLFSRKQTLVDIDLGVNPLRSLDASPSTKRLVVAGKDQVLLLDAETGAVVARTQERDKEVTNATFMDGGQALLVLREDGVVAKYDASLQSRKELLDLAKVPGLSAPFKDVVSNGSNLLTLRSSKNHVVLRYSETDAKVTHIEPYQKDSWDSSCAAPSPDGTRVLVAKRKQLQELDASTGKSIRHFPNDGIYNELVRYSPDGKLFLFYDNNRAVVYRVVDGARVLELRCERGCRDAVFSLDGKMLLMATHFDTDDQLLEAQCRLFAIP